MHVREAAAVVVKQVIGIVRYGDQEAGDVQIRPAVVVVIAPRRRGRVLLEQQPSCLSRRRTAGRPRCGTARSGRSSRRTDRNSRRRRNRRPLGPTPPNSADAPRRVDAPLHARRRRNGRRRFGTGRWCRRSGSRRTDRDRRRRRCRTRRRRQSCADRRCPTPSATSVKRPPSLRNSRFGWSRNATNRSRSPSLS